MAAPRWEVPAAKKFWKAEFRGQPAVDVKTVTARLISKNYTNRPEDMVKKVVGILISTDQNLEDSTLVSWKAFDIFLMRFGPSVEKAIEKAVKGMFGKDGQLHLWYHGTLSREEAERALGKPDQPSPSGLAVTEGPGRWLVRATQGDFCLGYTMADKDDNIEYNHHLIYNSERGYSFVNLATMKDEKERAGYKYVYSSVAKIVKAFKTQGTLQIPVLSHLYQSLGFKLPEVTADTDTAYRVMTSDSQKRRYINPKRIGR